MSEAFPHIVDFLKVRETCLFCGAPLWCRLTNFARGNEEALPILNAPLKDNRFTFRLDRTTANYTVGANGIIDIGTNIMVLESDTALTPAINQLIAKETFLDFKPHVQLYCPKKSCPQEYTVMSDTFKVEQSGNDWLICPFKLYLEGFAVGSLWVCNDYAHNIAYIDSRVNDTSGPMTTPLFDFQAMGPKKLLTRVKTIAIFS